ncbi:hypothetical protein Anapl_00722 [Anas platyrhynchos]|uniref:Uncharacterized protein n=1 Tax=Anas platyrhynchos TaxID=8839 RepID=R0LFU9_ANAPL|nr:hypothetical protein Anapl_00722 [Anas platyrhynchos]
MAGAAWNALQALRWALHAVASSWQMCPFRRTAASGGTSITSHSCRSPGLPANQVQAHINQDLLKSGCIQILAGNKLKQFPLRNGVSQQKIRQVVNPTLMLCKSICGADKYTGGKQGFLFEDARPNYQVGDHAATAGEWKSPSIKKSLPGSQIYPHKPISADGDTVRRRTACLVAALPKMRKGRGPAFLWHSGKAPGALQEGLDAPNVSPSRRREQEEQQGSKHPHPAEQGSGGHWGL